jgi:2-hydroxyacyl-CoA lyase 1
VSLIGTKSRDFLLINAVVLGFPVTAILEQVINHGIKYIGFRNEQSASYAATAYGYLTNKPACCIVVGGPGVVHAMAGV